MTIDVTRLHNRYFMLIGVMNKIIVGTNYLQSMIVLTENRSMDSDHFINACTVYDSALGVNIFLQINITGHLTTAI